MTSTMSNEAGDQVTEVPERAAIRSTLASTSSWPPQEIESLRANAGLAGWTLLGNDLANRIFGGARADTLIGGAGDDRPVGGIGADSMSGGLGNDIYYVNEAGDQGHGSGWRGSDTICTGVDFFLAAHQEIESLRANAGLAGLTLSGNDLANRIFGARAAIR